MVIMSFVITWIDIPSWKQLTVLCGNTSSNLCKWRSYLTVFGLRFYNRNTGIVDIFSMSYICNKKYVLSNSECVQCNFFFIFYHVMFIQLKICCCVHNFIKIGWFFTEALVTIIKDCARGRYYTVEANYWRTQSIMRDSRATFVVKSLWCFLLLIYLNVRYWSQLCEYIGMTDVLKLWMNQDE